MSTRMDQQNAKYPIPTTIKLIINFKFMNKFYKFLNKTSDNKITQSKMTFLSRMNIIFPQLQKQDEQNLLVF